ncbi:hypothetical protein HETIRDRAFT_445466 [Heterobasidion irregulare TC 32-1]|uniref:Uncharacterized protein n=1 Tax=Heterobasidion irregulare (strain TC 32-1) TaxID=747525 RepID=W4K3F2_HETIT|nr:uncharacterized protein HETIRDRAFT_445466 [Heterobasidion irregulare TC 32-1]ETW79606.1 hypothetical protein HETIRDRAFT_445466 [Heterobasidion irregulare TC 32-1]
MASHQSVQFCISDAIVVWRACVLWQDHKKLITVHLVLLSCAIAINLVNTGLLLTNVVLQSDYLLDITGYLQQVSWPLALVTNMVATSSITYKAWQSIRQNTVSHRRTAVEKIMIVFIESGTFYCVIWIALIASERLGVANGQPATHMSTPTMMQLAGIYPTLIIIFVARQKTVSDMSGHSGHGISSTSAFAAAPANRIASTVASHLDTNGVGDVHVHGSVSLELRSSASMGVQEGTRGGKSKEMVVSVEEDMALSV